MSVFFSVDKEIQQGLFTCDRNLDYFFPHGLSLFGTTLVRDLFDSRVYICRVFLFFSFQVIQHLRYVFPGLLFAEILSWLKILMMEKLIVKNLSTLDGL